MSYTIKEVAERFNISTYTLRYYENEGLLPPIRRSDKGIRQYCDVDLEWVQLICCMRATGMSISHIKNYIDLCRLGEATILERRQIILHQKEIIEGEIHKYKNLLKVVNKKIKHYDELTQKEQEVNEFN